MSSSSKLCGSASSDSKSPVGYTRTLISVLQIAVYILATSVVGYFLFVGLLAIPLFQSQAIYLNGITLTWSQDLGVPEQWGFLKGQVTPFSLPTPDGETIHAWHILPLELYRKHEQGLVEAKRLGHPRRREASAVRHVFFVRGNHDFTHSACRRNALLPSTQASRLTGRYLVAMLSLNALFALFLDSGCLSHSA